MGIGHLVTNACDCGPCAFPVQRVSAGVLVNFPFLFGGREGSDGRVLFRGSVVLQALVCGGRAGLFCVLAATFLLVWVGKGPRAALGYGVGRCGSLHGSLCTVCLSWAGESSLICYAVLFAMFNLGGKVALMSVVVLFAIVEATYSMSTVDCGWLFEP